MKSNPMIFAGASLASMACLSAAAAEAGSATAPLDVEEYATFTLRVDHLLDDEANEGQVVLTTIASTREVVDDVVALMNYHGQSHFLNHRDIRALLAQVEGNSGCIVYVADPSKTYIVTSSDFYETTLAQPAPMGQSRLNADSSLLALADQLMKAAPTTDDGQARKFWAFVANAD